MSYLNDEYKKYFSAILEDTLEKLIHQYMYKYLGEEANAKLNLKINYLKIRIRNIKEDPVEFDHEYGGYEPSNEWNDIPEIRKKLLGYNDWLNERRNRRIDSVCES